MRWWEGLSTSGFLTDSNANTSPKQYCMDSSSELYYAFNWPPCTFCITANGYDWWILTKTRSTHGTHVPWLPGIWWRFNDSRLMTWGFFCWQERDYTDGGFFPPLFVSWQYQQKLRRKPLERDILASLTSSQTWVHVRHRGTGFQAPDLTQSWGERRGWQQPRYSPCRTPELLAAAGVRWLGGGLLREISLEIRR